MFTDDQDEIIGGWEPMEQTRKVVGERGATATDWRIHTPICAASRSELQSGRYGRDTDDSSTPVFLDEVEDTDGVCRPP